MIHNNRAKSSSLVRRNLMNKGCARPNTSNYVTRPIKSGFGNLNSDIFDIDSYTIRASHDLNQTQVCYILIKQLKFMKFFMTVLKHLSHLFDRVSIWILTWSMKFQVYLNSSARIIIKRNLV